MAQDFSPNAWIGDWSEDGTDITIPIASFPELTAAEADGDTGDIRKVLFAIMVKVQAVYDALAVADRPTRMQMSKSSSVNAAGTEIVHYFQTQFTNTVATQDVADEPA